MGPSSVTIQDRQVNEGRDAHINRVVQDLAGRKIFKRRESFGT